MSFAVSKNCLCSKRRIQNIIFTSSHSPNSNNSLVMKCNFGNCHSLFIHQKFQTNSAQQHWILSTFPFRKHQSSHAQYLGEICKRLIYRFTITIKETFICQITCDETKTKNLENSLQWIFYTILAILTENFVIFCYLLWSHNSNSIVAFNSLDNSEVVFKIFRTHNRDRVRSRKGDRQKAFAIYPL